MINRSKKDKENIRSSKSPPPPPLYAHTHTEYPFEDLIGSVQFGSLPFPLNTGGIVIAPEIILDSLCSTLTKRFLDQVFLGTTYIVKAKSIGCSRVAH